MTKQEREWIKKNLQRIFITDQQNDCQTEDAVNFLCDLALKVGFKLPEDYAITNI